MRLERPVFSSRVRASASPGPSAALALPASSVINLAAPERNPDCQAIRLVALLLPPFLLLAVDDVRPAEAALAEGVPEEDDEPHPARLSGRGE